MDEEHLLSGDALRDVLLGDMKAPMVDEIGVHKLGAVALVDGPGVRERVEHAPNRDIEGLPEVARRLILDDQSQKLNEQRVFEVVERVAVYVTYPVPIGRDGGDVVQTVSQINTARHPKVAPR